MSKPCPSRHSYIFALTNHSLKIAMNFSIGLNIDLSFVMICYECLPLAMCICYELLHVLMFIIIYQ